MSVEIIKRMRTLTIIACLLAVGLGACRGQTSTKPPIHPNPNMDNVQRFDPQEANHLFADGRAARTPEPGTVSRGELKTDSVYYQGRNADGTYTLRGPLPIDAKLMQRGQERYQIYCGVCHDRAGTGKGLVVANYQGFAPPPSFHEERLRQMADGEIFHTITNGIRTMPSYRHQVSEHDRWAIIAYIRALQRSQRAPLSDVPVQNRSELEPK